MKAPQLHRIHKMTVLELNHIIFILPNLYQIVCTNKLLNKMWEMNKWIDESMIPFFGPWTYNLCSHHDNFHHNSKLTLKIILIPVYFHKIDKVFNFYFSLKYSWYIQTTQLKNGYKNQIDIFPKRKRRLLTGTWKDAQHC